MEKDLEKIKEIVQEIDNRLIYLNHLNRKINQAIGVCRWAIVEPKKAEQRKEKILEIIDNMWSDSDDIEYLINKISNSLALLEMGAEYEED